MFSGLTLQANPLTAHRPLSWGLSSLRRWSGTFEEPEAMILPRKPRELKLQISSVDRKEYLFCAPLYPTDVGHTTMQRGRALE